MKYKRQFMEEERLNPFFEALSKQDFTEDYIKWLENKYEQAKQLTLFDVGSTFYCNDNQFTNSERCKKQCKACLEIEEISKQ